MAREGEKLFRLASMLVLKREESLVILERKRKGERAALFACKRETWLAGWSSKVTRRVVKNKEERAQKEGRGDSTKSYKEGTPKKETKSRVR